jgi:uncharacterized membrane protein
MPQTTFAGHPLHPQLITMPAGLLPFSLVLDILHLKTGRQSYADAAYYTMIGGLVGGLAAGAAGAADYFTIPPEDKAKKVADTHATLNIGLLALTGLNLALRSRGRRSWSLPLFLSLVGNLGLLVSAWYGGHLVFEHGIRVKPAGPPSHEPEVKLPGDDRIEQAIQSFSE